jgi:hypothetical protein|tara:strand:- start:214 stop:399 length:186 start_codon:yes stop_codon:yes gene_type:complete
LKAGDLIIIKPYFKNEGRRAIIINNDPCGRRLFLQIVFSDNGEETNITPGMAEVISEARER